VSEQQTPEPETTPEVGEEFQPITSQEELNKRIGERIAGVKKKYADYDELRSKATEFDKLQEASKTETQKRDERISVLEKELLTERRRAFAATKSIPVAAVHGDTLEEWEASAEEILAWRADQEKPTKPKTTSSSNLKSGATGTDSRLDGQERAAAAIRAMRRQ
jgi:hypothetical protein